MGKLVKKFIRFHRFEKHYGKMADASLCVQKQCSMNWLKIGKLRISLIGSHLQNESLFTTEVGSDVSLKPNRPALVLSSTSWRNILENEHVKYDQAGPRSVNVQPSYGRSIASEYQPSVWSGNSFFLVCKDLV